MYVLCVSVSKSTCVFTGSLFSLLYKVLGSAVQSGARHRVRNGLLARDQTVGSAAPRPQVQQLALRRVLPGIVVFPNIKREEI